MVDRYVASTTTFLYEHASGSARQMVLIYGDRVTVPSVPDPSSSARVAASFRGRQGFVRQDRLMTHKPLEIYFIDVGQGDATFIVTPAGRKILIDGGLNRRALGFLIWMYRLDQPNRSVDIDLLVLSHADGDHLDGLVPIVSHPQIHVDRIIHNGIATYRSGTHDTRLGDRDADGDLVTWHDELSELDRDELSDSFQAWFDAISAENCTYGMVDTTFGTIDVGDPDITLEVLGPHYQDHGGDDFRLPWFGSAAKHAHTINGHSVVLRLTYDGVSVMLSGDLNIEGSEYLLGVPSIANRMAAHVFKTPHHGSHEFHVPFLQAVRPQISVVSSGDAPDHGHPRANFLAAIGQASRSSEPLMFSTEIAATFIEAGDELGPADPDSLEDLDFSVSSHNVVARKLFKQRLPGIINVRTDGSELYAARRVNAAYWWESYGEIPPTP